MEQIEEKYRVHIPWYRSRQHAHTKILIVESRYHLLVKSHDDSVLPCLWLFFGLLYSVSKAGPLCFMSSAVTPLGPAARLFIRLPMAHLVACCSARDLEEGKGCHTYTRQVEEEILSSLELLCSSGKKTTAFILNLTTEDLCLRAVKFANLAKSVSVAAGA